MVRRAEAGTPGGKRVRGMAPFTMCGLAFAGANLGAGVDLDGARAVVGRPGAAGDLGAADLYFFNGTAPILG